MKNLYRFAYKLCNKKLPLLLLLFGMLFSYQAQANVLSMSATRHPNKVVVEELAAFNHAFFIAGGSSSVTWFINDIQVGSESQGGFTTYRRTLVVRNRSFYVPHLAPNSTVTVRAVIRHFGTGGAYINTLTLVTTQTLAPHTPVSNVQATDGRFMNQVSVTWDINQLFHNNDYQVFRDGVAISAILPAGTRSFVDHHPLAVTANYSVRSRTNGVVQWSATNPGSRFNFNLQGSTNTLNAIVLNWNNIAQTHAATGITVEFLNPISGHWEEIWRTANLEIRSAVIDTEQTPFIPGFTYQYRVRVLPIADSDVEGTVSGRAMPNGRISGRVRTPFPGHVPVSGITVQARLVGQALSGGDTTTTFVTTTNHYGEFVFNNIYYYRESYFIITPIADRKFSPDSSTVNLTVANNRRTVDFTDLSSFTIAGNISNDRCPVAGVHLVIGSDTLGITDSIGNFLITVDRGGEYTITPRLDDRNFHPNNRTLTISANRVGVNFFDSTAQFVRGRLQASCNTPIGRGTMRFFGPNKTSPCFDTVVHTDMHGYYSIRLPAGKYYYNLVNFTSDDPDQLKPSDVLTFFSTPRLLDLSKHITDTVIGDTVNLDLVYRIPPQLQMSSIGYATTCSGTAIPLVKRYKPIEISFTALDDFLGNQCPAADGIIIIRENISSNGMDQNIDTLFYRKGEPITYTLIPGTPNLIEAQGFKKFFEARLIRDGQSSETIFREVIVLGDTPREQNFLTVSPTIPFHIIHNPPGDGSYSFMEANQTITSSFSQSFLQEGSVDTYLRVQAGPVVGVEKGFLGIAGASIEARVQADITATLGVGSSGLTDWATTFTTTFSEFFKTGENLDFVGGSGDVYIGGALNFVYGITDVLTYDFRNCRIERSQALFMQPSSIASTFIYTESHITDVIIPELRNVARILQSKNKMDSAQFYLNQMGVWEQVVKANHDNIEKADSVDVIAFSGGVGFTRTHTASRRDSKTIDWDIYIDKGVAVEAGVSFGGIGVFGGVAISSRSTWGSVVFDETEQTNTVGFHLSDDDLGDEYLVQVLNNRVHGTPAFRLISGQSSCPHEPGTLPREGVQLSVMGHRNTQHVPETEAAVYVLQLANISQSDEVKVYDLIFDHTSNPGGAVITIGGSPIVGGIPYSYTIPAWGHALATITVRKGPIHDTYDGLRFILRSPCDENVYDEVILNATFFREYNLNMFVNGNGTTNITGRRVFREGSVVGLFAMPNMGYEFQKWVVGTTEYFTQALAVTMDRSKAATAHFVRTTEPQFTVRVSRIGNGTTFPESNTYVVNRNALFTISANPELHNAFVKWTINGKEVTDPATEIIVTENTIIVAEFISTHTVSINTVGRGFVTPDIATHILKYGSELSLYASPQLGYVFDRWVVGNTVLHTQHASITVDRSLTATAHFVPTNAIQHLLGIANSVGGITNPPAGSYLFTDGSVVNVTAIPNTGKVFQKWIINGVENNSNPANISVTGGVNVEAFFIDDLAASSPNIVMDNITVFPNPANEMVTVKFGSEKVNRIEIFNSLGHSVILKQVNNARNSETFDISTLQPGIYFIKIGTANGNIVKRLVKE